MISLGEGVMLGILTAIGTYRAPMTLEVSLQMKTSVHAANTPWRTRGLRICSQRCFETDAGSDSDLTYDKPVTPKSDRMQSRDLQDPVYGHVQRGIDNTPNR